MKEHCRLRIPPRNPSIGERWTREDNVTFVYTEKGWEREQNKQST